MTAHTAILITQQTLACLAGYLSDLALEVVPDDDVAAHGRIQEQLRAIDIVCGLVGGVHAELLADGIADELETIAVN